MTEDEMVGWHHQLYGHEFGAIRELVKEDLCGMIVVNLQDET